MSLRLPFLLAAVVGLTSACNCGAGTKWYRVPVGFRVANQYIVILENGLDAGQVPALASKYGATVLATYADPPVGFLASANDTIAQSLSQDSRVQYLQDNALGELAGETVEVVGDAGIWHLDRDDQTSPVLDGLFHSSVGPNPVDIYIPGTVSSLNPDFGGRLQNGTPNASSHDTMVAGVAASATFGVDKQAKVIAVAADIRNLGQVLAAVDTITRGRKTSGRPSVSALACQFPIFVDPTGSLEGKLKASMSAGVVWAIAAGNSNDDACNYVPSCASNGCPALPFSGNGGPSDAIVVAGSDRYQGQDVPWRVAGNTQNCGQWAQLRNGSGFGYCGTNVGPCVTLFAPAATILTTYLDDPSAPSSSDFWDDHCQPGNFACAGSGTSFSAPAVAGAAALYLSWHPGATPHQVKTALVAEATRNVIQNVDSTTPNLLLYVPPTCGSGADCLSGSCSNGVCDETCSATYTNATCVAPPTDAGVPGMTWRSCAIPDGGWPDAGSDVGSACDAGTQCSSGVCSAKVCVSPSCADHVQNGGETDVDCGGCSCTPCAQGKLCSYDSDCLSGSCDGGSCAVVSYTPTLGWVTQIGPGMSATTEGEAIAVDRAGNVIVVGEIGEGSTLGSVAFRPGMYVVKLDPAGHYLWSRNVVPLDAGFGPFVSARGVEVDSASGDLFVTGSFNYTADFGFGPVATPTGASDTLYLARLYALDGGTAWVDTYPITRSWTHEVLALDPTGEPVIAGPFTSGDLGLGILDGGFFAAAYNPSTGAPIWTQAFAQGGGATGHRIAPHGTGVLIAGELSAAGVNFGPGALPYAGGQNDVFLLQLDAHGNPLWSKSFGSICSDSSGGISSESNGDILLGVSSNCPLDFGGGPVGPSSSNASAYLARLSPAGGYQWARWFSSTSSSSVTPYSVSTDAYDNICFAGTNGGPVDFGSGALYGGGFLVKLASTGLTRWAINAGASSPSFGVSSSLAARFSPNGDVVDTGYFSRKTSFLGQALDAGSQSAAFMLHVSP